jgi:two-component system chemotaxis response regulator CheB
MSLPAANPPSSAREPASRRPVRVMIVDDSLVIRGVITRILKGLPGVEVVASVSNGMLAVERARKRDIDVIVLDIEMPVLDGISALPRLMEVDRSLVVIMASTLTNRNADISIQALSLGASDYIPKPTAIGEIGGASDFAKELVEKVIALGNRRIGRREPLERQPVQTAIPMRVHHAPAGWRPKVLGIGSSTGGPQALLRFLMPLKVGLDVPVFITQHMPPKFTEFLASHLAKETGLPCAEARDGEIAQKGSVYVAPGDHHMIVTRQGQNVVLHLNQGPKENYCRPSVDPMLKSLVATYGDRTLAVILTGMGSDGHRGCEDVVRAGGAVAAQDEATSVVWGMPGAVARAGLCSTVLPLEDLARHTAALVSHR